MYIHFLPPTISSYSLTPSDLKYGSHNPIPEKLFSESLSNYVWATCSTQLGPIMEEGTGVHISVTNMKTHPPTHQAVRGQEDS